MNLMILSRRSIAFKKIARGEITALLVPGRDQIQITKDLSGLSKEASLSKNVADAKLAARGPQLLRTEGGLRYIYGYLPDSILELRQSIKVWLAEDFAPLDSQAFFYVISPDVVIHGVLEQNDDGQKGWRTAQLTISSKDPMASLIDAVTDYIIANPSSNVCLAVYDQLDLYQTLTARLEPFHITPVPFSMLKPKPGFAPLYRHGDHTVIYLTACLFGFLIFLACSAFTFLNFSVQSKLERDIQDIHGRIASIQYNQSIGHIRDPQSILNNISKPFNQQPSAILDAAGSFGAIFGDLSQVNFSPERAPTNRSIQLQPGQVVVEMSISKNKDKLLADQELRAQQAISVRPWVRAVYRDGLVGNQSQLSVVLQADQAPQPGGEILQQLNVSSSAVVSVTEGASNTTVTTENISSTVQEPKK